MVTASTTTRAEVSDDTANLDETPLSLVVFWAEDEVGFVDDDVEVDEVPEADAEFAEPEDEDEETRAVPPTAFGFDTRRSYARSAIPYNGAVMWAENETGTIDESMTRSPETPYTRIALSMTPPRS